MVPIFTNKELFDICTLRTLLEGATAERAAMERTDAELDMLLHHCDRIEKSADTHDLDLFLEANYNFHIAIAHMGGWRSSAICWARYGCISGPRCANLCQGKEHFEGRSDTIWTHTTPSSHAIRKRRPKQFSRTLWINTILENDHKRDVVISREATAPAQSHLIGSGLICHEWNDEASCA